MTDRASKTSTGKPCTEQVKGSVKEAIGKLTGDVRVEAEGRRQKAEETSRKGTGPRKD
ncbi:CsbD family protein [Methylobacterium sp. SyP6R]|uniref:CsbD family protein n=1 Tax=Methylobacterium sp. SyP6R TaxID=2718876 RepID=UPI001F3233EF|nr:CsbD family protein [Methylobacterium sp. SyP6R]MCF4127812.1 CsbD family protein [Methylobacterium sp. SyP6R]